MDLPAHVSETRFSALAEHGRNVPEILLHGPQSAAYSDVVDVVTVINSGSSSAAVTLMGAVQAAVSDGSLEVCAPSNAAAANAQQGLSAVGSRCARNVGGLRSDARWVLIRPLTRTSC